MPHGLTRFRDMRRAETLRIRSRRDGDIVKMFEIWDTAETQVSRHETSQNNLILLRHAFTKHTLQSETDCPTSTYYCHTVIECHIKCWLDLTSINIAQTVGPMCHERNMRWTKTHQDSHETAKTRRGAMRLEPRQDMNVSRQLAKTDL